MPDFDHQVVFVLCSLFVNDICVLSFIVIASDARIKMTNVFETWKFMSEKSLQRATGPPGGGAAASHPGGAGDGGTEGGYSTK